MVGSSLVDSDGENLALLCQLSQGTARWWHGVWLQGKKGKLNQLWCISLQSRACAQSVIAAQLSHSASYRLTQTGAPVLWSCSFRQKHPQVEGEGGGSAVSTLQGALGKKGRALPPAKLSHSTQANCTHTLVWASGDMGMQGQLQVQLEHSLQGLRADKAVPALSKDPKAPAAQDVTPTPSLCLCRAMSRTESFLYFEPYEVSPCRMSQWRSCSQHCCFCTLWNSCQNI